MTIRETQKAIRQHAYLLRNQESDYEPLLMRIGNAPLVLLGEASHGTTEFYRERARITRELILKKGFQAVAVEADWPDAYRVNRYVRGPTVDRTPDQALAGFKRFPGWMWRNVEVEVFVSWLRSYNDEQPVETSKVGFYGLDLYSLHSSMAAVTEYLDRVDPEAAKRARYRYSCFEDFGEDTQAYGYAANFGLSKSCENEVLTELVDLQRSAAEYLRRDGRIPPDAYFFAEQNARVVKNAEHYYRSMFQGRISSWNLRDRHMLETLNELIQHLSKEFGQAKIVVWAHNSHIGDARATEVGEQGEWNIGQLTREQYGPNAFLVGFTTHSGTVTAASQWDGAAERKIVRPALPGSYEAIFHEAALPAFLLSLEDDELTTTLLPPRLERAIGVIYRPDTERVSHYFSASLPRQFDVVIHLDQTSAIPALESVEPRTKEVPETYPSAL
jgi:erythromycin esterase-like protein